MSMPRRMTATEVARNFSDVLNRVRYRGEEIVIERGGEPVAKIVPVGPKPCTVAELSRLLASLPKPDKGYLDLLEEITRNQPPMPKPPSWD